MGKLRRCRVCKEDFPIARFYLNGSGKPEGMCKQCRNTRKEEVRRQHKIKFIKLLDKKRKVECERCGYNKSFAAIDFHHKGEKILNISKAIGKLSSKSFVNGRANEILMEIDSCEILCSNCHREEHEKYPFDI